MRPNKRRRQQRLIVNSSRGDAPPRIRLSALSISEAGGIVGELSVVRGAGSYTFAIDADPDSKFTLENDIEVVAASLNFEAATFHPVTISASGGDIPVDARQFIIFVTNVQEVTLVPLTLDEDEIVEDTGPGIGIGDIVGKSSGSSVILADDAGGRFAISGTTILTGAVAAVPGTYEITIRETHADAANSPLDSVVEVTITPASAYEAESEALFAAFTTPADDTRKGHINTCFVALKTAGVLAKLEALYVFAAADAQAARVNWLNPSHLATAVGTPTFTADEGYSTTGGSYVNTGIDPTTTVKYLRDSASFGIFVLSSDTGRHGWLEGSAAYGGYLSTGDAASDAGANINGAFNVMVTSLSPHASPKLVAGNRSGASAIELYVNGALVASDTTPSEALGSATPFWIGSRNFGGGTNANITGQMCATFIGGSLDATEQDNLYDALVTYLTAVGAL